MRISVFAWDANPAVDRRMYPLSGNRAIALVDEKRAKFVQLPSGRKAIQMLCRVTERERGDLNRIASFGDWFSSKISYLPKECWPSHGPFVRITTKQLAT